MIYVNMLKTIDILGLASNYINIETFFKEQQHCVINIYCANETAN